MMEVSVVMIQSTVVGVSCMVELRATPVSQLFD